MHIESCHEGTKKQQPVCLVAIEKHRKYHQRDHIEKFIRIWLFTSHMLLVRCYILILCFHSGFIQMFRTESNFRFLLSVRLSKQLM